MSIYPLQTFRFCYKNLAVFCIRRCHHFASRANSIYAPQKLLFSAINAEFGVKRQFCSSSDDGKKSDDDSDSLRPSLGSKFKVFKESDSKVILDFDEKALLKYENQEPKFLYQKKQEVTFGKLNTERGPGDNVFEIEDVVEVLRHEKMADIAVIRVPKSLRYCDYLVLATAMSQRHLSAFVEFFVKLHKRKRHAKDPFLVVEGKTSKDWKVIDLGHIVVHAMMPETRMKYDIEMLWTCGSQYDDLTQKPVYETSLDLMAKHTKFLDELTPLNN